MCSSKSQTIRVMQLTPDNNIGITSSMQGRVSEGVTVFWIISLYHSHRTRKVASQSMCGPGQDIAALDREQSHYILSHSLPAPCRVHIGCVGTDLSEIPGLHLLVTGWAWSYNIYGPSSIGLSNIISMVLVALGYQNFDRE